MANVEKEAKTQREENINERFEIKEEAGDIGGLAFWGPVTAHHKGSVMDKFFTDRLVKNLTAK